MFENDLLTTKEIEPTTQPQNSSKTQIYIVDGFFENFTSFQLNAKQRVQNCYAVPESKKEELTEQLNTLQSESIKNGNEFKNKIEDRKFPQKFWLEQQIDANSIIQRKDWTISKKVNSIFLSNHLKRDLFHLTYDFEEQMQKNSQQYLVLIKNSLYQQKNEQSSTNSEGKQFSSFKYYCPYNYNKLGKIQSIDQKKQFSEKINSILENLKSMSEETLYFHDQYNFKINLQFKEL